MIVHVTKPLFGWDELQSSPNPRLPPPGPRRHPDGPLLAALNARRNNVCKTYPVGVLWGVLLLAILLRPTTEACLEELRRNAPLRLLVGIVESESAVPNGWNLTRVLTALGQPEHLRLLRGCFDHMVTRLGLAVPDLGTHTAGDSSATEDGDGSIDSNTGRG